MNKILWQTRGAGRFQHRWHPLTAEQAHALEAPTATGVHALEVDGEVVFGIAAHTPRREGRPLLWGPVVYASREDAEEHGEAWLARDRDAFYQGDA